LRGVCLGRLQIPWQEFFDARDRMFADACEHLAQKRFGVVTVQFRAAQQAVDRRGGLAAGIATGE
jgi:hypothetical protein